MTNPRSGQDELAGLLNVIGDMVVRRGADGRIAYVNDAFRRAYGGAREDWVGRWFMFGVGEGEDAQGGRRRLETVTDTVGGPMWIEWEETRLADGGVVAVGRDVSARRADEEAARGARDAAEEMGRAKETLFATVTHELRTPLNGVIGMADLLANTKLTPEQRSYVRAVRESGGHLLSLVDDVLDAAKLEAGAFALTLGEADPAEIAQDVAELVAPRAREKGLDVAVYIDPRVPALIHADGARLRQILLNLAGNAVKFTEAGGVLVTVEREDVGCGEAALVFAVHDTGPGVRPADRSRIFEAFAQGDGSPARRAEGTGLGLAIVARLAGAMNGRLGLDDRSGGGSVFWVRARFAVLRGPGDRGAELAGMRAVVATPHALTRTALSRQLAAMGAEARPVASPTELEVAIGGDPEQIALVDAAFARAAAPAARHARAALLLAAPDERGGLAEALSAGFGGWSVKPCRPASLAEQVGRVWRGEPSSQDDEPGAAEAAEASPPPPAPEPPRDGPRVLLVEDNPVNSLLARTLLQRLGCAVTAAGSGRAALEAAEVDVFDLILMDMRLPGMDGLEATRRLRREDGPSSRAPVVALTAN
ncbi:MAG: ATP-binding protein, partial [Caulobacterales bacterium]|nr:ATP-binding protein [Caulobacterales bacterium]